MTIYRETTQPCTSYVRASSVMCMNVLDDEKRIQFSEETVFVLPDGSTARAHYGDCSALLTADNASTRFALRDPVSGDPTGATMSYMDVYTALMSLYYHVAQERDAAGARGV